MQKPCFWCEDHENRSFLAQSSVGGMAAVCKRLEAAQSFLKQVSQLPNFGALRNKQHESLLLLLKKTKVLNLKDVNSIFQMMDAKGGSLQLKTRSRGSCESKSKITMSTLPFCLAK